MESTNNLLSYQKNCKKWPNIISAKCEIKLAKGSKFLKRLNLNQIQPFYAILAKMSYALLKSQTKISACNKYFIL